MSLLEALPSLRGVRAGFSGGDFSPEKSSFGGASLWDFSSLDFSSIGSLIAPLHADGPAGFWRHVLQRSIAVSSIAFPNAFCRSEDSCATFHSHFRPTMQKLTRRWIDGSDCRPAKIAKRNDVSSGKSAPVLVRWDRHSCLSAGHSCTVFQTDKNVHPWQTRMSAPPMQAHTRTVQTMCRRRGRVSKSISTTC